MSDITLDVNGKTLPLRLTMRRVRIIRDLVGLDLMSGTSREQMADPLHVVGIVYALAGGTPAKTGLTLEDFEDDATPGDLRHYAELVTAVMKRDVAPAGDEGNAPADAPA